MSQNKEDLDKLLLFIEEIANEKGNEWFKDKLSANFKKESPATGDSNAIDAIYEYCIQLVIKDHAEKFYSDFKLTDLKKVLISDFIRMEQYRRADNFEDFCLAAFQQFEAVVNRLFAEERCVEYIKHNNDLPALMKYDHVSGSFVRKGNQTISKLVFQTNDVGKLNTFLSSPSKDWFFNHKFRSVLYTHYFNTEIKTTSENFDKVYEIGNFLYQGRNMNHRGSTQNQYQQLILDNLVPNQHKYYFKFLGFLEDFITNVNSRI